MRKDLSAFEAYADIKQYIEERALQYFGSL
ncbi:hypothetical protein FIU82_07290 [Pseudoalteromonas sp. THAF3]|nr:hypothetical protein FIU82_07290 [Pseudoalteromonas sp. THAF3]